MYIRKNSKAYKEAIANAKKITVHTLDQRDGNIIDDLNDEMLEGDEKLYIWDGRFHLIRHSNYKYDWSV